MRFKDKSNSTRYGFNAVFTFHFYLRHVARQPGAVTICSIRCCIIYCFLFKMCKVWFVLRGATSMKNCFGETLRKRLPHTELF